MAIFGAESEQRLGRDACSPHWCLCRSLDVDIVRLQGSAAPDAASVRVTVLINGRKAANQEGKPLLFQTEEKEVSAAHGPVQWKQKSASFADVESRPSSQLLFEVLNTKVSSDVEGALLPVGGGSNWRRRRRRPRQGTCAAEGLLRRFSHKLPLRRRQCRAHNRRPLLVRSGGGGRVVLFLLPRRKKGYGCESRRRTHSHIALRRRLRKPRKGIAHFR